MSKSISEYTASKEAFGNDLMSKGFAFIQQASFPVFLFNISIPLSE